MKNLKMITMVCIFMIISTVAAQQENGERVLRTNPEYEMGDWISYPMTRWINALAQGMEFMYFGSTGGITRYNFYTHKWDYPYTSSNGLADNDILEVAYDFDTSYLWCATPVSLSCYIATFQRWENYYFDESGISDDTKITSIGFNQDYVWAESDDGKILRGNKQGGGNFTLESSIPEDVWNSIRWYGYRAQSQSELPRFFMSGGYFFEPEKEAYISDINLNRYNISGWLLDKWGDYYVATFGLGVGKAEVRIDHLDLMPYGLFLDNVSAMAYDEKNGIMWVGGVGNYNGESGITSWRIESNEWTYYQAKFISDLPNDQVTSIAVDNDPIVWFGTEQGLARFNRNKDEWKFLTVFNNLSDNFVYDVALDKENVWIATASGLSRIRKNSALSDSLYIERVKFKALKQVEVYDVEVMDNLVWLGTEFGVYVYDMDKDSGGFLEESGGPMTQAVYAVSCYGDEVWFGTEGSIEVYDVEQQKWLGVPERRFDKPETIFYLVADKDAVWAGTEGHGILKYDRERKYWRSFTTFDGLIDNRVNAILMDGDYVWLGGPMGITRFYWNDPYRVD